MNMLRKRLITICLALFPLVIISGCWSAFEINDRAFATIILLDLTDKGETELSLGFLLPNRMTPGTTGGSGAPKGEPFTFVTKAAENISQAYSKISVDISRPISFGHTQVIVIGEKYARQGVLPIIQFAERQTAFHLSSNIFVTHGNVSKITKTPLVFEPFVSTILSKYIRHHYTLDSTVKDVIIASYKGGDILLPFLNFTEKPEIEVDNPKKNQWIGTDGAAIISGGKMSNIKLNPDELRGSLWMSAQIKSTIITVASPSDGKEISCVAQDVSTNFDPVVKNGEVSFKIKSKAKAFILDNKSDIDLSKSDTLIQIKKKLNEAVKNNIEQVLIKTREAKSDAFLMSNYLDWQYPKAWKKIKSRWKDYYSSSLPIDISVDIDLDRTGGNYRSVEVEKTD
ncbi:Ger(x)C family spore germination protein [Fontibacillus panacisegetis]|nr:Ger(x)C family spore germination protein [Fontibacillus panacisegetis]